MKITAELRAQARMIADAPEGAELMVNDGYGNWYSQFDSVLLGDEDCVYRLKEEGDE